MNLFRSLLSATFVLVYSTTVTANSVEQAKSASRQWQNTHGLAILNDFRDLLSLPNVASDRQAMNKNADWIEDYLAKRQFKIQRLDAGGAPYIFAELNNPDADKTLLIYAHFDGQPIKPENWVSPAWQPQLRDDSIEAGGIDIDWPTKVSQLKDHWRIFARSAGDDKAPVIALMAAIDALKASGLSPSVNIKLILDGEEEAGSPSLKKIIEKYGHLLKSDLMLFCDGPMHQSRKRQLVFGVRGVTGLNITSYGPQSPLHSGHYGNWAPNAAEQMATLLASLHDQSGRIAIKNYYDDVRPMTEQEKQAIDAMPNIQQQLLSDLAIHSPRLADIRVEKAIMQPAVVITGIEVGSTGQKARNVLVPKASASINFRLVANQSPKNVMLLVEKHFESLGYFITDKKATAELLKQHAKVLTLNWEEAGYPAFRASLDTPIAKKLKTILTKLDGYPTLMTPTMGGSLPIYLFEKAVSAPIIILPIANHDNNQHGPNENLKLENLWQAIDAYAAVILSL